MHEGSEGTIQLDGWNLSPKFTWLLIFARIKTEETVMLSEQLKVYQIRFYSISRERKRAGLERLFYTNDTFMKPGLEKIEMERV